MSSIRGYRLCLLFEAMLLLLKWDVTIRFRPFSTWKHHLSDDSSTAVAVSRLEPAQAVDINRHIECVVRHFPIHLNCMRRSLALKSMLNRRQTPTSLHIGVRFNEHHQLAAHAWINLGDTTINDDQDNLKQYSEITQDREHFIRANRFLY